MAERRADPPRAEMGSRCTLDSRATLAAHTPHTHAQPRLQVDTTRVYLPDNLSEVDKARDDSEGNTREHDTPHEYLQACSF